MRETSPHALVVGGTGMLRGAVLELARRAWTISLLSRGHARLSEVSRAAAPRVFPTPSDYTDDQHVAATIRAAITARGPITLAVCWIHESKAPQAAELIATLVEGTRARPCRFVHVVGSSAADPTLERLPAPAALEGMDYRRAILGFVQEKGVSRWLTNDEISAGVLQAIDADTPEHIVGVVNPWELRPG